MNERRMIYRPEGYALSFEWSGGAYINMYALSENDAKLSIINTGAEGAWEMLRSAGEGHPFHALNVWDYATDQPTIERTREAFIRECDEWLADPDNRRDYGL